MGRDAKQVREELRSRLDHAVRVMRVTRTMLADSGDPHGQLEVLESRVPFAATYLVGDESSRRRVVLEAVAADAEASRVAYWLTVRAGDIRLGPEQVDTVEAALELADGLLGEADESDMKVMVVRQGSGGKVYGVTKTPKAGFKGRLHDKGAVVTFRAGDGPPVPPPTLVVPAQLLELPVNAEDFWNEIDEVKTVNPTPADVRRKLRSAARRSKS